MKLNGILICAHCGRQPVLVSHARGVKASGGEGEGLILARTAAGGSLAPAQQVRRVRDFLESLGLSAAKEVTATGVSGISPLEEREHLVLALEHLDAGGRWIACTDLDRISRNALVTGLFLSCVEKAGGTLCLVSLGRAVDWARDRLLLTLNADFEEERRAAIGRRSARARQLRRQHQNRPPSKDSL